MEGEGVYFEPTLSNVTFAVKLQASEGAWRSGGHLQGLGNTFSCVAAKGVWSPFDNTSSCDSLMCPSLMARWLNTAQIQKPL